MQPPRLDVEQVAPVYGDRLGPIRSCRSGCGALTRQAHHKTRPEVLVDVDASPGASGDYWHPRIGWRPAVAGTPHDLPRYAAHLCPAAITSQDRDTHMTMFGTPNAPGSTGPATADLVGHPLLINVREIRRGIETKFGVADAVACEVVLLDTGDEHPDTLLFSRTLTQQLVPGTQYLGRLHKENLSNGNTAWRFNDTQADAADMQLATGYLAHKAKSAPAAAPSPAAAPAFNPAASAAPTSGGTQVISPPWAS